MLHEICLYTCYIHVKCYIFYMFWSYNFSVGIFRRPDPEAATAEPEGAEPLRSDQFDVEFLNVMSTSCHFC